jgi:pSer/pThr/pTyr-binding forkhead associated (FHA) protein
MFQLYDKKNNRRYPLTGLIKEIGRTSECDFCLVADERVSRVHARLEWDGKAWTVVDLESTNGTMVNGKEISEHKLKPGDVLEVGDTCLQYLPLAVGDEVAKKKITVVTKEKDAPKKN